MRVSTRSEDYTDLIPCLSTWHLTSCHSGSSHSSELELEGELNRARSTNLVKRAEAAALPATTQRAGQHLRGLAELRRAEEIDWAAEIGVIEDVEEVGARLKSKPLGEVELPPQRAIDLDCIAPPDAVASQLSLPRSTNGKLRRSVDQTVPP